MSSVHGFIGPRKVFLASILSIFVLAGCQGTTSVPINAVYGESESANLELAVGSCDAHLKATLDESASAVRIRVEKEDDSEDSGGDCQDSINVELSTPLAGRKVVDDSSDQTVEVQAPN